MLITLPCRRGEGVKYDVPIRQRRLLSENAECHMLVTSSRIDPDHCSLPPLISSQDVLPDGPALEVSAYSQRVRLCIVRVVRGFQNKGNEFENRVSDDDPACYQLLPVRARAARCAVVGSVSGCRARNGRACKGRDAKITADCATHCRACKLLWPRSENVVQK